MKILLLTEFFPADDKLQFTGGVESRSYFITKYFPSSDRIAVICRKTKTLNKATVKANIYIYPCGLTSRFIEAKLFSLFERLIFIIMVFFQGLRLDFDVIEGSNFVTYLPAFLLGLVKKKPKIAWFADVLDDQWLKYFGVSGLVGKIFEWLSLKLSWNKIIALSNSTRNKLIKAGLEAKKIEVVYGGTEITNSKLPAQGWSASGRKVQISKRKEIICISRLVNYKRIDDLIKAFSGLIKKYPNFNLVIIGQGPEENNLRNLTEDLKIVTNVNFFKNLPRLKLIDQIKHSYLLCLPSIIEGFGLVTIEAAACQTPYVISDIEVNKEITKNGLGGLFFKKEDVLDLQNKLLSLITNKKLYDQKQKECLLLANNYRWQKISQQTRGIYLDTIK